MIGRTPGSLSAVVFRASRRLSAGLGAQWVNVNSQFEEESDIVASGSKNTGDFRCGIKTRVGACVAAFAQQRVTGARDQRFALLNGLATASAGTELSFCRHPLTPGTELPSSCLASLELDAELAREQTSRSTVSDMKRPPVKLLRKMAKKKRTPISKKKTVNTFGVRVLT